MAGQSRRCRERDEKKIWIKRGEDVIRHHAEGGMPLFVDDADRPGLQHVKQAEKHEAEKESLPGGGKWRKDDEEDGGGVSGAGGCALRQAVMI
jgi:hypothetical protein